MRDPKLIITLEFVVTSVTEADLIYTAVKKKLESYPNVQITASIVGEPQVSS